MVSSETNATKTILSFDEDQCDEDGFVRDYCDEDHFKLQRRPFCRREILMKIIFSNRNSDEDHFVEDNFDKDNFDEEKY